MPDIADAQIDSAQFNDLSADYAAPAAGRIRLFFKGGLPYFRKSSGAAVALGLGSALNFIYLADEKTQTTPGGTATSGANRTRDITHIKSDAGGHCSLDSNQFTLVIGSYRCYISAPAFAVEPHMAFLKNITDNAIVLEGTSEYADASNFVQTRSLVVGRFTIAAPKAFEIQHVVGTTKATNGFGVPCNISVERYTIGLFWKE